MKRSALMAACVLLAACDSRNASLMANSAMDEMRGAPSADAIAKSAHFEGGGIAFDYPAVLRLRHEVDEDGDVEWNFEYGMYTLEVYAPKAEVRAADYLAAVEEILGSDAGTDVALAPVTLCGAERTPAVAHLSVLGDASVMEAYDLPAPSGEARLLILDDELVNGAASPLGRATRERVLGSLRCGKRR